MSPVGAVVVRLQTIPRAPRATVHSSQFLLSHGVLAGVFFDRVGLSARERVYLSVSAMTAVVVVCVVAVYSYVVLQNLKQDRLSDCIRTASTLSGVMADSHVERAIADCHTP